MDNNDLVGVELKHICRVLAKPGELGYGRRGIPLDHYFLDINQPLETYTANEPMAVVVSKTFIAAYVNSVYYSNIRTVIKPPPGYQKIILVWVETPRKENTTYDN